MERAEGEEAIRLLRAIRSLRYNRAMLPLVEERIARAEATIRSHLLIHDTDLLACGPYEIRTPENEEIQLTQTEVDDWEQLPLPAQERGRSGSGF